MVHLLVDMTKCRQKLPPVPNGVAKNKHRCGEVHHFKHFHVPQLQRGSLIAKRTLKVQPALS